MTRARFLTLALTLTLSRGYTGEGTCRADDAQLAHVDAILHAKQQADVQVRLLNTQLATALQDADERDKTWSGKVQDAETRAANIKTNFDDINESWAYWIGWIIVRCFRWWITALLIAFAVRMLCALPWFAGNPFAAVGALVSTVALHVLTLGLTLTTNVPDNLFFLGELKRVKADRRAAQIAAASAGATADAIAGVKA